MPKQRVNYVCQSCGSIYTKWTGRCDNCGEWNKIIEEIINSGVGAGPKSVLATGKPANLANLSGKAEDAVRIISGIKELDRVSGGGFVKGSTLLVGGDPGIGKSTLLLQAASALANRGRSIIYISGEEAIAQVQLRAKRLGLEKSAVKLASETNVETILATLENEKNIDLVIIDSIQTLWTERIESTPGTVTQVRTSAQALTRFAKKSGASVILVGHVTKDGQIAGPKLVEHMVDGVIYFEGDNSHSYRILRAVKNRYGATDEIGVFEMTQNGLNEVNNPSSLFLDQRDDGASGSAVFAGIEGTRPILVEIQALVAPSPLGTPRRTVVGWDSSRLAMIIAVLETHCGVKIGANDIYLNIAGGLKITEPAADMAVAAALISSLSGSPLQREAVFFGEISLSGAIRPVIHAPLRLKEAAKLGFNCAFSGKLHTQKQKISGIKLVEFDNLLSLVGAISGKNK